MGRPRNSTSDGPAARSGPSSAFVLLFQTPVKSTCATAGALAANVAATRKAPMRVARPRLDMNTLLRPPQAEGERHGSEFMRVMSLSAYAIVVAVLSVVLHATGAAEAVTYVGHHPLPHLPPPHLPLTTCHLPPTVNGADAVPWFGKWQLEPPKTAPR